MTLFIILFVMIVYLVVNEFTHRNVSGIFVLMLLGQYTFFLTFSIVIDAMIPAEKKENGEHDSLRKFNRYFRITVHMITLTLLFSIFVHHTCDKRVYPANFMMLIMLLLTHHIYDIYLKYHGFMINWNSLPAMPYDNKLRFNQDLFRKQVKCLFFGNLLFGTLSALIIIFGFFIINRQGDGPDKK